MTIKHDIDKLFNQGLSDYSEKPPGFVWNNIENKLNNKRFRQKRNIMYAIAASVALLLSFGAGYLFTGSQSQNLMVSNQNSIEHTTAKTNINTVNGNNKTPIKNNNNIKPRNKTANSTDNTSINKNSDSKNSKQNLNATKSKPAKKGINKKNVIKATSAGMLLPPMYANTNEFDANKTQIAANTETNSNKLNLLKMKGLESLPENSNSELMYDIRQAPVIPDYTSTNINNKSNILWSVGISATPLMSYRKVTDAPSDILLDNADVSTNYEQNYTNEKPYVSYSAGVGVNCKVAKRWKIQSGLYFSELGQVSENVAITGLQPYTIAENNSYYINTSTGNVKVQGSPNELINKFTEKTNINDYSDFIPPGSINSIDEEPELTADFLQTYEYYEIPFAINYTIIDRKLSVNMTGGVSANIMYKNKTYVNNNNSQYELNAESEDLKNMNYSGILGLGFEYPLVTKLNFSLQPTLRYSLNSINNTNSVYPYSFGIYTGLRYNF